MLPNLRRFIQAEADSQREAIERQWARPIAERVHAGWAIEGLRLVFTYVGELPQVLRECFGG